MANVRDITTKCKAGQVQEAYDIAKADFSGYANRYLGTKRTWLGTILHDKS